MACKSMEVDIVPKILSWARESIGLSEAEVAKRLKTNESIVKKWELGDKKPTLIQLEKLAKTVYKRPLAAFFLPVPPKELPLPKDFRSIPTEERKPFSLKTLLAIRRARRLQTLTEELTKGLERYIPLRISKTDLANDPELVANSIRKELKVNIETQYSWKHEYEAFNEWKKGTENFGIFVFQLSMPLEETRAFSLIEGKFPAIVLNLSDVIKGRIFSLFHEFGHILLDNSGICNLEDQDYLTPENMRTEKFCNHFAGALLVPEDNLMNHELVRTTTYSSDWPEEILGRIAQDFKVSKEVIIRRLIIFNRASSAFYKRIREEWKRKKYRKKGGGHRNPPKEVIQKNGIPFVSLVLESARKEKITYSDVADYLAIRLKYLPKVEQLIGE
jgi:Zn-dependent peptidase ImmA (M78 family)